MIFYFILSAFIILLAIGGWIYYKKVGYTKNYQDNFRGDGFSLVMVVIYILITIGFTIASLIASATKTYREEDLLRVKTQEKILVEKAVILTAQFSNYLVEIYPDIEKSIFNKIAPENVHIYLVKYPELRSSETIRKLVDEISKLQDNVYDKKLLYAEIQRDINYYYKNPWIAIRF